MKIKTKVYNTGFVIDPKIPLKLSFRQVVSRNPALCEKALDSRSTDCGNDIQVALLMVLLVPKLSDFLMKTLFTIAF